MDWDEIDGLGWIWILKLRGGEGEAWGRLGGWERGRWILDR